MAEHIFHNEEDAATHAISNHISAYGVGDHRLIARAALASVSLHRTRNAARTHAEAVAAVEEAESTARTEADALAEQEPEATPAETHEEVQKESATTESPEQA